MTMEFRVLGPIEVHDGERLVDLGPRMPKAVLAVLLLEPGRVVSLDRLIDLLWGEQPPAAATSALQVYISGLRRALEPGRAPRTPPSVLVTQPPGYALRVDPRTVDAVRFEELVATGRDRLAAGDVAAASESLRAALALWRGSPYSELTFESFLQEEIARLGELRCGAWETLMDAELALGRHAAAVVELERLANEEPIRERRWELLALALYRDGRQAEALRVLQQARQVLGEELGIEPGPSLRRLEDDMFAQSPSLDWHPPSPPDPIRGPVVAGRSDDAPPAPSDRPLVGRDAEVAQLLSALEGTATGRGRALLISGEPGIGKSRLAEELAGLAAARGALVAWGRCHEGDTPPAYWPWVQIVRSLAEQGDREAVRQVLSRGSEELAQIVPEVKELAGRPLEPLALVDPEAARTRLYDAVIAFVLGLAAEGPVVLVVDDLHWADPPSLQLVQLLAARLSTAPVLLTCTYREHDARASAGVVGVLGALARVADVSRVRPTGLDEDDVARLVAGTTGREASREVSKAICARTEGNPFFVGELVRLLQSKRQLPHASSEAVSREIPSGVRDVIDQRLARLPEETLSLLRVAAVAGRDFELDVVARAAGVDGERGLELIESALAIGVVVESPDAVGRYRFSHSLVRETLDQGLSALRRARLHRALGEALCVEGDESQALEIAHHFYAATPLGGHERAYDWALRAADRAGRLLAFEQAEDQLRRALALAEAMGSSGDAARRQLTAQTRLGTLLLMTRGYSAPEAGEAWSGAVELCRQMGDAPELLTAMWGAWSYACVRGDFTSALALATELLERGDEGDDVHFRLIGHQALAITSWHLGRLRQAEDHVRQLGDLCGGLPAEVFTGAVLDRDPRMGHLALGGLVRCLLGRAAEGAAGLDAGVAHARDGGRPFGLVLALFFSALGGVVSADPKRAATCATEAAAVARERGFRQLAAMADVVAGWAAADADRMRRALADFEASGSRMLLHLFHGLLGEVEHRHGRRTEALECVDRALRESESTGERFWEADLHRLRAELLLAGSAEESAGAHESFERALAVARSQEARALETRVVESLRRSLV